MKLPFSGRNATPLGLKGKCCAISIRASMFFPSPCASWSSCGHQLLTPSAGPVRRRGAHSLVPAFPTPGIAKPGSPTLPLRSPVRVPGLLLAWPLFRLPLPTSGAGTGDFGLREEPPLGSGRRLHPGRLAHLSSLPTVPVCRDLPSPPQRPMLDGGFSLPFGAVMD